MFIREIWRKFTSFIFFKKIQKSELSKFIPNFPLNYVITSTNFKCTNNYIIYNLKYVSQMILIRQNPLRVSA